MKQRKTKQEIIDLLRAVAAKEGDDVGLTRFCKIAGLNKAEVDYYFPDFGSLRRSIGLAPNSPNERLADDVGFEDYAKVCLHFGKIPNVRELRILTRELKTRTGHVYSRETNGIVGFQSKFRAWLPESSEEFKKILSFAGWSDGRRGWSGDRRIPENMDENSSKFTGPLLHPYLPGLLQNLDVLAKGEIPPFENLDSTAAIIFERRTAEAFRCLGFEVQPLGQGSGRKADALACAPKQRVALIIDAKVRSNGYVLGTEDRKFLEYVSAHGKDMQKKGYEQIYFVVVGSSFRQSDLDKLAAYLSASCIRSIAMITARALMRIVEESIRDRARFALDEFCQEIFGNKIIDN